MISQKLHLFYIKSQIVLSGDAVDKFFQLTGFVKLTHCDFCFCFCVQSLSVLIKYSLSIFYFRSMHADFVGKTSYPPYFLCTD